MLNCKDITKKANGYLDKELPYFTRLQVKLHLLVCVHCQRYINQLRATIRALGKLKKDTSVSGQVIDDIVNTLKHARQNLDKPEK
ncbi:MAG: zf-HC2 domain-containing protein [Gammaproteobacteria bacterium]|nr:zf-HC2 domain-containing protein [Gammaproteobacteria bacterium]